MKLPCLWQLQTQEPISILLSWSNKRKSTHVAATSIVIEGGGARAVSSDQSPIVGMLRDSHRDSFLEAFHHGDGRGEGDEFIDRCGIDRVSFVQRRSTWGRRFCVMRRQAAEAGTTEEALQVLLGGTGYHRARVLRVPLSPQYCAYHESEALCCTILLPL